MAAGHHWLPLNVTLCLSLSPSWNTVLCGYQAPWLHLVELRGSGFCSLGYLLMLLERGHQVIHPFLSLPWVLLNEVLNFRV